MERIKQLLRLHTANVTAVLFSRIAGIIGVAFGIRLITEFVSPEVYGSYKLIEGVLVFVIGLFLRPLAQYVMRGYHGSENLGFEIPFLAYSQRVNLISTITLGTILFIVLGSWGSLTGMFGIGVVLSSVLLFSALGITGYQSSILITQNKQVRVSWLSAIVRSVPLIVTALIASRIRTDLNLLLLLIAVSTTLIIPGFSKDTFVKGSGISSEQKTEWKKQAVKFILPLIPVGIFSWMLSLGDRYMIGIYREQHEVGIYSAVYGLVSGPVLLAGGIASQIVTPLLFKQHSDGDDRQSKNINNTLRLTSALIALAAFLFVLFLGKLMIPAFLGESYRENVYPLMCWIVAGHGVLIIAQAFDLTFYAEKKTRVILYANALAAVTNLGLNFLWIPRMGGIGAAQATFYSYLIYLSVVLVYSKGIRRGVN